MSNLSEKLEWALMTLQDKLTFGMDESIAVYRREARVRGVLVDAVKEVKRLEEENEKLRDCAEFYADTGSWDAIQASDDSIISGVISQDDIYEPWDVQGISVGGRRAKEVLKELDKENG